MNDTPQAFVEATLEWFVKSLTPKPPGSVQWSHTRACTVLGVRHPDGILLFTVVAAKRQRAAAIVPEDSESRTTDSSMPASSIAGSLLRICLGLLILADLVPRARHFTAHYTDLGVAPRDVVFEQFGNSCYYSLHWWLSGSPVAGWRSSKGGRSSRH